MPTTVLVTLNSTESFGERVHQVRERHLASLRRAGLLPILAPGSLSTAELDALLTLARAVYLPGGDYVPRRLRESDDASRGEAARLGLVWDPLKVRCDVRVLRAAWKRELPTLAVCGGCQALAIIAGGRLGNVREGEVGWRPAACEVVELVPGTLAARIFGERAEVNSFHRQAVLEPGRLAVAGRNAAGTPEALEASGGRHPFWLGLQWHPELLGDERPYAALAAATG
jgi:gamma-glutamyl-gamma-aminobutyrate hydrolase PuuD